MADLYDDPAFIDEYLEMSWGHDAREAVAELVERLPPGSRVLEIGTGPGRDLDRLAEHFDVVGSDTSRRFLDHVQARRPETELVELDARTLAIDRVFDGIFSSKVLHHLTTAELSASFERQAELLRRGGYAVHTFWSGDRSERDSGLWFQHYTEETLRLRIDERLGVEELVRYTELEDDDSLRLILERR